ncbi:hypothetical protein V6C32_10880 [Desulforamulus ruminis]
MLFALGKTRFLRWMLFVVCSIHLGLLLIHRPDCPTCVAILLLEVALLLLAFRIKIERSLQKAATAMLIFIVIGIFFAYQAEWFMVNPPSLGAKKIVATNKDERNEVEVWDQSGNKVKIPGPVLFFAWWCPECEGALLENRDMVLVSTFFEPGKDNIKKSEQKLRLLGVSTDRLYFLPENPPVDSVPTIYPEE